ncbi:MAG: hypothetical protein WA783_20960 [Phormidesmis sp.]
MSTATGATLLMALNQLNWTLWTRFNESQQIIVGFSALVAVTTVSFLLHNLQVPITRFFEGYWASWPLLKKLKKYKTARYCDRFWSLEQVLGNLGSSAPLELARLAQKTDIFLRQYPPKQIEGQQHYKPTAYIMPTRLGNIYRSAELYSLARYGLDSTIFWPHLVEVMPERFLQRLQDLKIAVDFWLLSSLLLIFYFIGTLTSLIFLKASLWAMVLMLTSLLLCYGCYRIALTPALAYGSLIRVAFDLYRRPLLESLGCTIPATLDEERQLWMHLQLFMYNGAPMSKFIKLSVAEPTS